MSEAKHPRGLMAEPPPLTGETGDCMSSTDREPRSSRGGGAAEVSDGVLIDSARPGQASIYNCQVHRRLGS